MTKTATYQPICLNSSLLQLDKKFTWILQFMTYDKEAQLSLSNPSIRQRQSIVYHGSDGAVQVMASGINRTSSTLLITPWQRKTNSSVNAQIPHTTCV